MRRKLYPINVLRRASHVATAWEQLGTDQTLGSVTHKVFTADITTAGCIEAQIREAEIRLRALRNERDAHCLSMWDKVKRVYDAVKSLYGDDSIQYEMVGRKRISQRKRRARRIVAG